MGQKTLQFDNKRYINLTKILKNSCKVAIERACKDIENHLSQGLEKI